MSAVGEMQTAGGEGIGSLADRAAGGLGEWGRGSIPALVADARGCFK